MLLSVYVGTTVTYGCLVGQRYAIKRDLNWWETAFYTGVTGLMGTFFVPLTLEAKALGYSMEAFQDTF